MHLSSNQSISLRQSVEDAGLYLIGVSAIELQSNYRMYFAQWLERGWQAGMEFMTRHRHIRENPANILIGAQSVCVVAQPYDLKINDAMPNRVAAYACYEDYHRVVRKKCEQVILTLMTQDSSLTREDFRIAVDSAPILERAIAMGTGRGFIGKNTCFIEPGRGSAFFLAEIFCTKVLNQDAKLRAEGRNECGTCRRCVTHCPTGALDGQYNLDANKCLSYWTIEHRGAIPYEFWKHLPKFWYGCDICQRVCPFNRVPRDEDKDLKVRLAEQPDMFEVATMTQQTYERIFGGTPMTRAKREGLQRNALIVMRMTGDSRLNDAISILQQLPQSDVIADTIKQIESFDRIQN